MNRVYGVLIKTTYAMFIYLFVFKTYFGVKMSLFVKLLRVPLFDCHCNKNITIQSYFILCISKTSVVN